MWYCCFWYVNPVIPIPLWLKDRLSINHKYLFILVIVRFLTLLAILGVILIARYLTEEQFRDDVDTKVFKKQVEQDKLSSIEIDYQSTPNIFAYDKYIAILNKNKLLIYSGEGTGKIWVRISECVSLHFFPTSF